MEPDCGAVRKQDQPSIRELAPALDWEAECGVESQFSEFTVSMTRKQLTPLPLLGAAVEDLT